MLLIGVFASFTVIGVSAADTTADTTATDTTPSDTTTDDKTNEKELTEEEKYELKVKEYLTKTFNSPEEKLASMTLKLESDGYQLYIDEYTGETATLDTKSGQILFSNPWDVATEKEDDTKAKLLSQIAIKYSTDTTAEKEFWSFSEAAVSNQIQIKNIKNGLRVEYIIGREEAKKLVPRMMTEERYQEMLYPYIMSMENQHLAKTICTYFTEMNPDKETVESIKNNIIKTYPIIEKVGPIRVIDGSTTESQLSQIEEVIKTYCPHYTYEELEYDHNMCEYEGTDTNPPLFKLAIEYSLDENGVSWTMPANGLRFDEGTYKLNYLSVLPFMGAGSRYVGTDKTNTQEGYSFFPDGSGTLIEFQGANSSDSTNLQSKVYGEDYAYHTITGRLREAVRYPVFGIVEQQKLKKKVIEKVLKSEEYTDPVTGELVPAVYEEVTKTVEYTEDRGFVGIIEEGDALATISLTHDGTKSKYNWIQMYFYPRPSDKFKVSDAISGGEDKELTVTSSRRYVGNYTVRYIMLTDSTIAEEKGLTDTYPCSWVGMARAYSDYLVNKGELTRLTEDDIESDYIPLYIETFGTMETLEKILSIPVNVMTPLTTFEDIQEMYDDLNKSGIKNVNFKLNGYANGGMYGRMPYKLKWESAVGGKEGFESLIAYAKEVNARGDGSNLGIFPDFEFSYAHARGFADGLNMKKHAVRTIDDRYTGLVKYSATYQSYIGYYGMAISPAYMSHFYDKFTENYLKYDPIGISVGSLGSDLNSDFDEDEPYNREDSKGFITKLLAEMQEDYGNVMADKGNAYTWKYVDHLLNVPIDSSRYIFSSNAVPFIGVVLHGYVQFAGTPYNMEGNTNYAFLKAIENGASIYFTLTKQNAEKFKEYSDLSQYYSISYEIWYDELCKVYLELNDVLKDVQTKIIIDHEFLTGERLPDINELEADILDLAEEALKTEQAAVVSAALKAQQAVLKARRAVVTTSTSTAANITSLQAEYVKVEESYGKVIDALDAIAEKEAGVTEAEEPIEGLKELMDAAEKLKTEAQEVLTAANKLKTELSSKYTAANRALSTYRTAAQKTEAYTAAKKAETDAKTALDEAKKGTDQDKIDSAQAAYDAAKEATEATVKAYCESAGEESKKAYEAYETAYNAYYDQVDIANAADTEYKGKNQAYNDAKTNYDNAVTALETAKKAVSTAVSGLTTAVTTLNRHYTSVMLKNLENGAISSSNTANDSLDLINSQLEASEDIKNEAAAYVATTLANATSAVNEGLKLLPLISAGHKLAAGNDEHRMDELEADFNAAFAALKAADEAYKAIENDASATIAQVNAAKKVLEEAETEFQTYLKEAQSVMDSIVTKLTNATKLYNSAKLYKEYIDASATSTDEQKAEAASIFEQVKADYESISSIAKDLTNKVNEFNTLIKGYGVITVKEVTVSVDADASTETPAEGTTDEGSTEGTVTDGNEAEGEDDEDGLVLEEGETKYTSNDGQIVLVTYGGKNGNDSEPYKSFILNFNYFAVTVTYGGRLYTIPANGYVVIMR